MSVLIRASLRQHSPSAWPPLSPGEPSQDRMMGPSLYDINTVPQLGDWGLANIDSFEDIDINMESMELINDNNDDPFGDFTLEQSFNLIELNNLQDVFKSEDNVDLPCDSDSSRLLQDLDMSETLKQDCMWSSGVNTSSGVNINSTTTPCYTKLSLTPPTSYINESLHLLETPIPSDDESSGSDTSTESYRNINTGHSSKTDHCYTSFSLLTPPESSEDEDCLVSPSSVSSLHSSHSSQSKQRKNVLSEIENDRFNNDVKKSLLKSSQKNLKNIVKPKFKFSIRMKSFGTKSKPTRRSDLTMSSYQATKQKKKSLKFLSSNKPTGVVNISEGIKKDKLNHTDARNVHNMMERQRRTDLKRAFDKLKDYVPSIAQSDRTSKQMVLDKAIEHCKTLRRSEESVREQKKNLLRRNELLKKKLALLQSQVSASQVENARWEIQGW